MNDIFDEHGMSKVSNTIITVYNYHPETSLFTHESDAGLVKGFGIPANSTIISPIENPEGVNRWDGEKWIDDIEYGDKLRIEERKNQIEQMTESLHKLLSKLALKQAVGRITEEEEADRIKIINLIIDLDEFDVTDLTKELPKP